MAENKIISIKQQGVQIYDQTDVLSKKILEDHCQETKEQQISQYSTQRSQKKCAIVQNYQKISIWSLNCNLFQPQQSSNNDLINKINDSQEILSERKCERNDSNAFQNVKLNISYKNILQQGLIDKLQNQQKQLENEEQLQKYGDLPLISIKNLRSANNSRNSVEKYISDSIIQNQYLLSENYLQNSRQYSKSQEEQSSLYRCQNCSKLKQRLSLIEQENSILREQKILLGSYNSTNEKEQSEIFSDVLFSQHTIQILMDNFNELQKIFYKIQSSDIKYHDFSLKQRQMLLLFDQKYIQFKIHFNLCNQSKRIDRLNREYHKIISKKIEQYHLKAEKRQYQFEMVMKIISQNSIFKRQQKLRPIQKINKQTLSQKIQIKKQNQLLKQNKELNNKILAYQNNLKKAQQKIGFYQASITSYLKKYKTQIKQLNYQKQYYRTCYEKSVNDFTFIMNRLSQNTLLINNYSHNIFTQVSKRIFQISNCIPFEDNDEQNLFVPQNQTQLFEMIDRIYRFYNKIQRQNNKIYEEFQNYKKYVALFVKQLIESGKISLIIIGQMIKNYKQLSLSHLIKFMNNRGQKEGKNEEKKGKQMHKNCIYTITV